MNDKILKIKKSTLVDIADQVRAKTGSTDKIKVKDLDEAVSAIAGGGCVEVDVLPDIMLEGPKEPVPSNQVAYDDEVGGLMPTDGPISCNRIVINTSLSIDETVAEIQKVTTNLDAAYGHENSVSAYSIVILNDQALVKDGRDPFDYLVDTITIYRDWEDGLYKIITNNIGCIFNSNDGWDPIINSGQQSFVINNDSEIYIMSLVEWNNSINWPEYPNGNPGIINLNSELTNLIYTASETLNPEVDVETIYKLPDETMWKFDGSKYINLGEKYTPEHLGSYNNPEYGFYFGQVFDLDTPISFDASILYEEISKMDIPPFYSDNNKVRILIPTHDTRGDFVSMNEIQWVMNINQETDNVDINLKYDGSESKLDKTYSVSPTDTLTITLRQLYRDSYFEAFGGAPAFMVDEWLSRFPFQFGVVMPGYSSNIVPGSTINGFDTNYSNLNLPGLEIYKAIKIGK